MSTYQDSVINYIFLGVHTPGLLYWTRWAVPNHPAVRDYPKRVRSIGTGRNSTLIMLSPWKYQTKLFPPSGDDIVANWTPRRTEKYTICARTWRCFGLTRETRLTSSTNGSKRTTSSPYPAGVTKLHLGISRDLVGCVRYIPDRRYHKRIRRGYPRFFF